MDVRAVTFLSSFLLVIKGNLCVSLSNSLALSSSVEQSQLNQFTVPAVIKPIVTIDSSNLAPPNIPNYSSSSLSYQQPPLPIIIDNVSSRGSRNSLSNLIFLVYALKNINNGGGGNCGGCNGGGYNCGGCNCNGCNYYGGPDCYQIPNYPNCNAPVTEINCNGCAEQTTVTCTPISYPLACIEASQGTDKNEIVLTIKQCSC